ncbi:MAG: hypothetical protein ABIS01_18060, partial [Ferruginibacter sp.]
MDRRKFIKISGVSLSGLIINSSVFGSSANAFLMGLPDEVWIGSGKNRFSLSSIDKLKWTNRGITVVIKQDGIQQAIYVQSSTQQLNNVQLKWKLAASSNTKCLGDDWERTYGDTSWESIGVTKKMPWYFLQYDGKNTHCFGVKTGAASICYWQITNREVQLTMDTRSGGVGVQLGGRKLHAASIITAKSNAGETPFKTGQRFCKMMCDAPRLAKQPVYGINDWYFAYGK